MSALKSAAAVYESRQVRSILGTTQAACVFGLIVFAATVAQVLAPPLLVLLDGGVWTLGVAPHVALPLLVAACAGQALLLILFDRAPRVSVLGITAIHLLAAVGLGVPSWLSGMYLVIAASSSSRRGFRWRLRFDGSPGSCSSSWECCCGGAPRGARISSP